ncbi:MFS transporter [uncultured Neptuniibacter sp.]|uniref:MFS transporter n=1 Tax=uncultured Neptuniibacter sp. TaxID=502143 RepID=UPI00260956C9|nr:MFS transporter [uncultured Neptuniibacter sp.]
MRTILSKFFLPVFCPSIVIAIVQQGLLVVLPLYILHLGGSMTEAAAVVALRGLGMMVADVPAGLLIEKIGDKRMMLVAAMLFFIAMLLMAMIPDPLVLMFSAGLLGFAHGCWLVGRVSYVGLAALPSERGRVMALSAGIIRFGSVLGPLLAGLLIAWQGYSVTLAVFAVSTVLVAGFVLGWVENHIPEHKSDDGHSFKKIKEVMIEHRGVFATAGVGAVALMLVRSSRALLLPLAGAALALDESSIGLAISCGAVVDTLLFYPAGSLMDRVGRKPILITSLFALGAGLMLLPLAEGFYTLVVIAVVLGLGNGFSAGVIMTIGADLAPERNRGGFIGVWRLMTDMGSTAGPFVIGSAIKLVSLAAAAQLAGLLGILSAAYLCFKLKESGRED